MSTFAQRRAWHHRLTVWLSVCALAWGALWPTLSHAFLAAWPDKSGWVEVCSTTGTVWVQLEDKPAPPLTGESPSYSHMGPCGWCTAHTPHMGLPPTSHQLGISSPLLSELPLPEAPPVAFKRTWPPSLSRAPPQTT